VDSGSAKSSFLSLNASKLAKAASSIHDQDSYDETMTRMGLAGSRPEQIKARAYVLALVNARGRSVESQMMSNGQGCPQCGNSCTPGMPCEVCGFCGEQQPVQGQGLTQDPVMMEQDPMGVAGQSDLDVGKQVIPDGQFGTEGMGVDEGSVPESEPPPNPRRKEVEAAPKGWTKGTDGRWVKGPKQQTQSPGKQPGGRDQPPPNTPPVGGPTTEKTPPGIQGGPGGTDNDQYGTPPWLEGGPGKTPAGPPPLAMKELKEYEGGDQAQISNVGGQFVAKTPAGDYVWRPETEMWDSEGVPGKAPGWTQQPAPNTPPVGGPTPTGYQGGPGKPPPLGAPKRPKKERSHPLMDQNNELPGGVMPSMEQGQPPEEEDPEGQSEEVLGQK
jgi:hypothetical protein